MIFSLAYIIQLILVFKGNKVLGLLLILVVARSSHGKVRLL